MQCLERCNSNRAFTLTEVLVVMGILVLFLALSIPTLRVFQRSSHLESIADEVISTLRVAQSNTLASEGGFQYGVYFDVTIPHQYILFQGQSYATRDVGEDKVTTLQKTVEISLLLLGGGNEVVFERITGKTSNQGTVTFRQIADPANTKTVSILSSGAVEEDVALLPTDSNRVVDSRHVDVSYQGRTIDTGTESVRLLFPDTTFSFTIQDNMAGGQIFWEGEVISEGETQEVKVHTHILNDPVQGTQFSLHRDRGKNTKSLVIELTGDITGNIVSFNAAGIITQGTSIYAEKPQIQ
jgi:prepilin-type N-terminal cleavage/methylation domain-containing protein